MTEYPRFATEGEREHARKLIRALLREGCTISVWLEGITEPEEKTTDEEKIFAAMSETEAEGINAYRDGKFVGWFYLVYGNADDGHELCADYTVGEFTEKIYSEVWDG